MTYEGWANYHTWNVALWIANEKPLYDAAVKYAIGCPDATYEEFIASRDFPDQYGEITPDGVSWIDPTLDIAELDRFIRDFAN